MRIDLDQLTQYEKLELLVALSEKMTEEGLWSRGHLFKLRCILGYARQIEEDIHEQ